MTREADSYYISRAEVVSQGRSKNQLASMRMALPCWNMRVDTTLAFQNVESGKQRESAMAHVVVGRRPASRLREPELCIFFLPSRERQIAVGRQDPEFMRIKHRLSVLALSASRRRHEFPKYTHSPIYKVTPETPREPNSSVVLLDKMSAVKPRAAASLGLQVLVGPSYQQGRWRASASICAGGRHERVGILGLWRFDA